MKVKVDQGTCIGCALCSTIAPDVFEMRSDGKSHVIGDCRNEEKCRQAIESCPVEAIAEVP